MSAIWMKAKATIIDALLEAFSSFKTLSYEGEK